jgi:hypothetical protein
MAHYTKFDSKCDTSALLGNIVNINTFPKNVRIDAENVSCYCTYGKFIVYYIPRRSTLRSSLRLLNPDIIFSLTELLSQSYTNISGWTIPPPNLIDRWREEFEDTKRVIRTYKSKKIIQHNGQAKNDKTTTNALQNIHIKLKIKSHETTKYRGWTQMLRKGKLFMLRKGKLFMLRKGKLFMLH